MGMSPNIKMIQTKGNPMTKVSAAIALVLTLGASAAQAAWTYPILDDYEATAKELLASTKSSRGSEAERSALIARTRDLIQSGVAIMNLYAEKNPACAEQFKVFIAETPNMENLPYDQVQKRYHDGVGIPAAPKHCYFGRSQVVHPALNIIRLKGAWSDKVRASVVDDFEEVIEHLNRIQKNLDNPPKSLELALNSRLSNWECRSVAKWSYHGQPQTAYSWGYGPNSSEAADAATRACNLRKPAGLGTCEVELCNELNPGAI